MTSRNPATFDELLAWCSKTAEHWELRDGYDVPEEADDLDRWRRGETGPDPYRDNFRPMVAAAVARGVAFRRLRVVSVPATEYVRYEYDTTGHILDSGEQVRWIKRPDVVGLVPANDLWVFDGRFVHWGFFDPANRFTGARIDDDTGAAEVICNAFDSVWSQATPHADFEIG